MAQITTRLSPGKRRLFERYAQSLGLNGSALARLLIIRALRASAKPRQRAKRSKEGKLTAHFSDDPRIVKKFTDFASARNMTNDEVIKRLAERELKRRWLKKAAGLNR